MNDFGGKRIRWIELISSFLYGLAIWFDSFFPQKQAELIDISALEDEMASEWIAEFKSQMEDGLNG